MGIKDDISDFEKKIREGFEKTFTNLIEFKRTKDSPLIVFHEGEIVELTADEAVALREKGSNL